MSCGRLSCLSVIILAGCYYQKSLPKIGLITTSQIKISFSAPKDNGGAITNICWNFESSAPQKTALQKLKGGSLRIKKFKTNLRLKIAPNVIMGYRFGNHGMN